MKKAVLKNFVIFAGKLQSLTLLKRDFNTGAFLWILQNISENLFWKTSGSSCFWFLKIVAEDQWAATDHFIDHFIKMKYNPNKFIWLRL